MIFILMDITINYCRWSLKKSRPISVVKFVSEYYRQNFDGQFCWQYVCLIDGFINRTSMTCFVGDSVKVDHIEREIIPHLVHAQRSRDFKNTLRGSQGQFTNMLIREGHLGNVLAMLLASYDFHVHNAYIVGDVILKDLRQPPSLPRVVGWDIGWTPVGSRLLSTPKRRSGWALREDFLFFPLKNNANMASSRTLGPNLRDPYPLLLFSCSS